MDNKSPFTDSNEIPRSQSHQPSTPQRSKFQDFVTSPRSTNGSTDNHNIHSFVSSEGQSDQESYMSAIPTPNINVDRGFDLHPKQSSLRFKLPPSSSPVPTSPIPAIPSKANQSPFHESNVIIEDEQNEPSLSPFEDPANETDKPTERESGVFFEDQTEVDNSVNFDDDSTAVDEREKEMTMKRHRWGTTRNKKGRPKKENINRSKTIRGMLSGGSTSRSKSKRAQSIKKSNTGASGDDDEDDIQNSNDSDSDTDEEPKEDSDRRNETRSIMFNRPLLDDMVDEDGNILVDYARNKIRTTKYTPLSFLPKNISNQFLHNIANIYFLALIILGAFQIFGVPSPILAAVPLIVIVFITAIKDAIEDSRRTVSDMEINNQYTHILDNYSKDSPSGYLYENNNVNDERVSLWRRFKKWNTRLLFRFIGASKRNLTKEGRAKKARDKQRKLMAEANAEYRRSLDNPFEHAHAKKSTEVGRKSFQSRRSMQSNSPRTLHYARKYWKDVKVGDILRINSNDPIPADIAILATSEEDNCCYVETKDLDGETNLKVRQALKYGADIHRADDLTSYNFQLDSEGPHANLYSYQGNLKYNDESGKEKQEPITINNLLLRGCILRNTKWAVGVVVFTGPDTKVMLNAGITPTKQSRISRDLNYYVYLNFIILFVICFVSGLINGLYYRNDVTSRTYFEFGTIAGAPWKNGLVDFFVNLILYQSLVPISLYITIEIIKTAQAYFIYSDIGMYYEKLDFPCVPKSWSISDDLGQIEYIFSDKTGTLTQNVMEFRKCTINGVSYGLAYTEALAGMRKRLGVDVEAEASIEKAKIEKDKQIMSGHLKKLIGNNIYEDELTLVSSELTKDLMEEGSQKEHNEHFMLALALCHSVLTEENPKDPNKLLLKAQSPDEAALVGTARALGFGFKGTTKKGLLVDVQGDVKEFQVLNTLEFNSTRKRMSAIIKIPGNRGAEPTALLICKGADSIIYDRLSKRDNDPAMLEQTSKHLEEYAVEGLRTLCIAQRVLTWDQYLAWNEKHAEAASSLVNREEKMEAVADSIERELTLLGGTAIEDRLQDGVPDAIEILGQSGIKLWVLTGDKVETAINIGFSCNLLGNDMELLVIKSELTEEDQAKYGFGVKNSPARIVDMLISRFLSIYFQMDGSFEELEKAESDHSPPNEGFGVIIDGDALKLALLDPDTRRKFLLLCKQCKAVLCCRVSPAQKAAVVKLVKDTLDVMTLAVGDGSNDVAMIQAADVGVGIAGEEGRQAVMSSDYGIGQFRFLAKLLLTHGRWSYKRFAEMIPSFFFKNVIFSFTLFWYGIFINFDGTYLFEFTFLMFYNLAFTSLPVIFMGVLDQDVDPVVSMLVPQLYRSGILRSEWNQTKFWWYVGDGIYQSAISYFFPHLLYREGFPGMNGLVVDHRFWMGIEVTCISCIACNFYILLHQYRWDWLSSLIIAISIFLIYFWTLVWSAVVSSATEFYDAGVQLMQSASFWAVSAIGILICILPRFTFDVVQKMYWPKDIDIIRECVQRGDFAAYPINFDPTDPNKPKISNYASDAVRRMSTQFKKEFTSSSDSDLENQSGYGQSSAIPENKNERVLHPIGRGNSQGTNEIPQETNSEVIEKRIGDTSPSKKKKFGVKFPRKSLMSYDNSSLFESYGDDVGTEEIQLEDFDQNKRKMSRISSENQRRSR